MPCFGQVEAAATERLARLQAEERRLSASAAASAAWEEQCSSALARKNVRFAQGKELCKVRTFQS